jgi:hypothetical protein
MSKSHGRTPAPDFPCAFCQRRFATAEGAATHERNIHKKLMKKLQERADPQWEIRWGRKP